MDKYKDMNILLNFCFRRKKNVIFTFKKVKTTNYTTWDICGDKKKKPLVVLTHYYTSVNDDMKRCYKRTKKPTTIL